jgi:class 3 adenylate cyclase
VGGEPDLGYAWSGDGYVAYQAWGEGEPLLWLSDWPIPLEWRWSDPRLAAGLERVGSFSRAVSFDRRGIGISDPMPLDLGVTSEEWMNDALAVLDDLGWAQASVLASLEGSFFALMLAATHPDRVSRLVLFHGLARGRGTQGDGSESSASTNAGPFPFRANAAELMERWRDGHVGDVFVSEELREISARWHRTQISPSTMFKLQQVWDEIDVRPVLASITAPTLVVNRRDASVPPPWVGERLASMIPGARYITIDGRDSAWYSGDQEEFLVEVEAFLTGVRPAITTDRVLATVLFTDIVASTETTARLGDADWRTLLDRHDTVTAEVLRTYRGKAVKHTGDGVLATFDGPARAVRCAREFGRSVASLGIKLRAGIHTGEIERRGDDITGIGVVIARRICDLATDDQVWVSNVVPTLAVGSGLDFRDVGTHQLKGVPGEWSLLQLADASA